MATYYDGIRDNYDGTSDNDSYNYFGSKELIANGRNGNDRIIGNNRNDVIYGGNGNDYLSGWLGNDGIYGEEGNDKLEGESGNDTLIGGPGSDTLLGGKGNDTLVGSKYNASYSSRQFDVLNGGAGFDLFVLGKEGSVNSYDGVGHAIIQDYNSAEDHINIVKERASSYRLDKTQNLVGGAGIDTQIYRGNDLLAIVQDTTDLHLTNYYFKFG